MKDAAAPAVLTWPLAATVGALTGSRSPAGHFAGASGEDALVCCDLCPAGKFRHGAARWWCRTHMHYWGTLADLADAQATQRMRCALHASAMGYAVAPPLIDLAAHDSVVVRLLEAGPQGSETGDHVAPSLRMVLRSVSAGEASVDVPAVSLRVPTGLFADPGIVLVHVTPPALRSYARALACGQALGCVDCRRCGHPHLDLGDFSARSHKRHLCGNCGCDSIHSPGQIVSTPLHALRQLNLSIGKEILS